MVGFTVDACYEGNGDNSHQGPLEGLQTEMAQTSLTTSPGPTKATTLNPLAPVLGAKIMLQSTVAELKTFTAGKNLPKDRKLKKSHLPQFWFGRTPWLIMGYHAEGAFFKTKVTNVQQRYENWETNNQEDLRKLAGLLGQLREAVRASGEQRCAAVYEHESGLPVLKVYRVSKQGALVSDEVLRHFWGE